MLGMIAALALANLAAIAAQLAVGRALGLKRTAWRLGFRPRGASTGGGVRVGAAPLFVLPELVAADGHLSSRGRRALVSLSAPLGIWLAAVALFLPMMASRTVAPEARLSEVVAGSPAERVGLRPGDVITSFNGAPLESWDGLVKKVQTHPGGGVTLTVQREGQTRSVEVVLARGEHLGVMPAMVPQSLGARVLAAVRSTWTVQAVILEALFAPRPKFVAEGGPVMVYAGASGGSGLGQALLMSVATWLTLLTYAVLAVALIAAIVQVVGERG